MSKLVAENIDIAKKRAEEAEMVSQMIALWCRAHHQAGEPLHGGGGQTSAEGNLATSVRLGHRDVQLCPSCSELRDYALARIKHCPHMGTKTFCSACPTHCYKPEMRERIREVMRWSGPRMLRYRPIPAIKHAIVTIQSKRAKGDGAVLSHDAGKRM